MLRVCLTHLIPGEGIELLRRKNFQVEVNQSKGNLTHSELRDIFCDFDAVLTLVCDKIDENIINAASTRLKVISNYGIGIDNIDVLAAKRKGIIVTNTPGVATESVAEYTFALILACKKRLLDADKFVRSGKFNRWDPEAFLSRQICGLVLGIVGLGKIGTLVGHIAYAGFKMTILYFDNSRFEDFELLTEAKFCTLETIYKRADIITLHLPLNDSTKHLIGKKEFKMMKNSAILINTSRGAIIDEEALIWALSEGEIATAGLDVFENEPHVPQELATRDNVVLTPHIASATLETREAMSRIAAQNIIDVFEGKVPFGLVRVG